SVLVQNFPKPTLRVSTLEYGSRPFAAVYVGSITFVRGLKEMITAVHGLRRWDGVRLLLGGTFAPAEAEMEAKKLPGWDLVEWSGWASQEKVQSMLERSRVGLAVLHRTPSHIVAQPTKLFDYMNAGIPVVISDIEPWRKIVEAAGCGIAVDPTDLVQIGEAINWIFEHPIEAARMGEKGRAYAMQQYQWNTEAKRLIELYSQLSTLRPKKKGIESKGNQENRSSAL